MWLFDLILSRDFRVAATSKPFAVMANDWLSQKQMSTSHQSKSMISIILILMIQAIPISQSSNGSKDMLDQVITTSHRVTLLLPSFELLSICEYFTPWMWLFHILLFMLSFLVVLSLVFIFFWNFDFLRLISHSEFDGRIEWVKQVDGFHWMDNVNLCFFSSCTSTVDAAVDGWITSRISCLTPTLFAKLLSTTQECSMHHFGSLWYYPIRTSIATYPHKWSSLPIVHSCGKKEEFLLKMAQISPWIDHLLFTFFRWERCIFDWRKHRPFHAIFWSSIDCMEHRVPNPTA